jgi:hypothetical protein
LQSLLKSWPKNSSFVAWLDVRAQDSLVLQDNAKVEWVSASIRSRMKSELSLASEASLNDCVFCFHGLPPLLQSSARVIIFQQNRNYLWLR